MTIRETHSGCKETENHSWSSGTDPGLFRVFAPPLAWLRELSSAAAKNCRKLAIFAAH